MKLWPSQASTGATNVSLYFNLRAEEIQLSADMQISENSDPLNLQNNGAL